MSTVDPARAASARAYLDQRAAAARDAMAMAIDVARDQLDGGMPPALVAEFLAVGMGDVDVAKVKVGLGYALVRLAQAEGELAGLRGES